MPSEKEMQLKPCPFCGLANCISPDPDATEFATSKSENQQDTFAVSCYPFYLGGCGATGPLKLSMAEAIDAWNAHTVEALAEYKRVLGVAASLVRDAEKHLRSLSRSTYSTFYDADKIYAREKADALKEALAEIEKLEGK